MGQPVPKFSAREIEILEAVALGLSEPEVAQRSGISVQSVERHIADIQRNLRARNRAHMVAIAIVSGLISKTKILSDLGSDG